MQNAIKTAVICLLLLCYQHAIGQISYLNKDKPVQGESITIYYKNTPAAKLTGTDSIFTGIQYWNEKGEYFKKTIALTRSMDGNSSGVFELPKDAAYLRIRCYQLSKDDEDAALSSMIYNKGVPAQGATYQDFYDVKLDPKFHEEIERYPNNYFAYARYINALPADSIESTLPRMIAKLVKVPNDNDALLAALTVAYSRQGNKEMANVTLLKLLEEYPASVCTDFAFSQFLYEQYKTGGSMLATGILYDKLKTIFIQYPESAIAGAYNNIVTLSSDKSIPVAAFESAVLHLYRTGRIDYNSMGILPNLYLSRNVKLDEAEKLLRKNLQILSSGEIYHQYRLAPNYIYTYTTQYLRTLAKVHMKQQKTSEAITAISAALQQVKGSNFEGSLRPVLELELAAAYSKAGNYSVALDQYKRIYTAGNEKVKDSIARLYLKIADQTALDKFMNPTDKTAAATDRGSTLAPSFSGTDLLGKAINLSDYKGKIIVLNAWFIGCVPCIAEMPELNKLVGKYAGQQDVVFLGLTPDKTDALTKFLKKTSFKYGIVNNLRGIEAYDLTVYPQHIIIDKEGKIVYRTAGATPGITDKLSEEIEKLKRQNKGD